MFPFVFLLHNDINIKNIIQMKKLFTYLLLLLASSLLGCTQPYDDTEVRQDIENLKDRVTALEKLCKEMNANIDAMAAILEALETHDYITGVTPITKNGKTVGYTITFAKGEPITIYHGKDGKDGVNGEDGADGKDGYTPIIGVAQDSDGVYYWTLDGEWLLDDAGNKIKAVGIDGANGSNGTNGVDGITPQLKIENEYWYISYDNGATWIQLGKATGEDGKDGANGSDGADGKDGDSFFEGVDTSNDDYVVFTFADGTIIKIPTWYAFEQLKKQCEEMNRNITAMQQILEALQNNDYVTSVQQIVEDGKTIGYTIYFSKSGAVTIYHGENGKDGADGADGVDGTDGKDGADGKDGENGTDGKDGAPGPDGAAGPVGAGGVNGKDGKDGVTPLMEIRDGYWYLSVDNGLTWTQYGKATGKDGNPGADGVVPEVIISSVTWNQNTAYFTLKTGEVIAIPIKRPFEITLAETTDILIEAGGTILIEYIILGADDDTKVYCICEGGWKAEVQEEDFFSGNIVIRAPYPYSEGKVLVMAQNADDNLVIQKLTFREV